MSDKDKNSTQSEEELQDLKTRREDLLREIEEYNREREQIKATLGNIGGEKYQKTDKIMNIIFLSLIVVLFVIELSTELIPTFVSLEISVLLVSIKIVWMIHSQHKFNHFQFWVLNSIEFRMTQMDNRIRKVEKGVRKLGDANQQE
jgi:hypothetical protein